MSIGRYVPPPKLARAEVEREFASGDPERIVNALYGAFFLVFPSAKIGARRGLTGQEPAGWLEDWCFRFVTHSAPSVRGKAIITLGMLAAFGGVSDIERAIAAAKELLLDDAIVEGRYWVRMCADDALDDLKHAKRRGALAGLLSAGPDHVLAHRHSSRHRGEIERSDLCGCYSCLAIFAPQEIEDWGDDDEKTALCPRCGVEAVIGSASATRSTLSSSARCTSTGISKLISQRSRSSRI